MALTIFFRIFRIFDYFFFLFCHETGQVHDEEWRLGLRCDTLGDSGVGQTTTVCWTWRRGSCGELASVLSRHGSDRFPIETSTLSQGHLRLDVRVLAKIADRTAIFPWDPPVPAAQESRLLTNLKPLTRLPHFVCLIIIFQISLFFFSCHMLFTRCKFIQSPAYHSFEQDKYRRFPHSKKIKWLASVICTSMYKLEGRCIFFIQIKKSRAEMFSSPRAAYCANDGWHFGIRFIQFHIFWGVFTASHTAQ